MNCITYACMLLSVFCIFISSTRQVYEISVAHDDSNKKGVMVSWYKDGSFSHDSIIHWEQSTLITFDSYEAATLHEIFLSWVHLGKKYRSKLFPVFEGTIPLEHGVSHTYLWRLKMDGVYYSKDNDVEELYETWESLQQNLYAIRVVYKNWDGRKLKIRWNHDKKFHEYSTLEENSAYATVRFESYTETTLYELSVKWDVNGVKYESKLFPVFSRTDVVNHEDEYIYFWYLKMEGVYFCKDKSLNEELYKTWPNIKKEYEIKLVYEISDKRQLNIIWRVNGNVHQPTTLDENSVPISVRLGSCDATTLYEISVGWSVSWMRYESKFFHVFRGLYDLTYPYTETFCWSFKEEGAYFIHGESRELLHTWSSLTETITFIP